MSQEYSLDGQNQAALVTQLNATVAETLRECQDSEILKAIQTLQCDTVTAFIDNITLSFQNNPVSDEDTDLRLKILLQSKQILMDSKQGILQQFVKLMEENSFNGVGRTLKPKQKVSSNAVDENSVNFSNASSTKQSSKKRKRTALAEHGTEDVKVVLKAGFKAPRYQGARVFAFEDSEVRTYKTIVLTDGKQNEESPSKRARVDEDQSKIDEQCNDTWLPVTHGNEELASDINLFALDSDPEARQLIGSRECAIDVDLSKFNFERLEEKSSQPEHISSQPGRSMDVMKKLQQIESYLSETSEPQESCERDGLPTLLAYELSQTDYAAMVREEESQSKSKEDD